MFGVQLIRWSGIMAGLMDRCSAPAATPHSAHHASTASSSSAAGTSAAPSLRASSVRFFMWLARLAIQLPWLLFSSDPANFLPPKERKHKHHSADGSSSKHSRDASHSKLALAMPSLPTSTTAAAAAAMANEANKEKSGDPPVTPSPAAAASTTAAAPLPIPPSVAVAPPPPSGPPIPFLTPRSFPIPSSQAFQAQYCYSPHQPPTLLAQMMTAAGAAMSAVTGATIGASATAAASSSSGNTPPVGGWRSSSGPEALNMYQHVVKKKKKKKYTLVLDLDETLVHTTDKAIPEYDCRVEIHTKKAHRVFYILKRPFLDMFLVTLSEFFEIVIFTASIRRYADAVIDLIDLHHVVERRFFRQSCVKSGGSFLKDLRVVSGTDLRRTLLVDNSPIAYSLQEENGLPIATWYDDPNDTALRDLIPFMLSLRSMDDVRALLYRRIILQRVAERQTAHAAGRYAEDSDNESPDQLSIASRLVEADEEDDEFDADPQSAQRQQKRHAIARKIKAHGMTR